MKRRVTWFVLTLILAMGMVGSSVLASGSIHNNGLTDTDRMNAYDASDKCKKGVKADKNVAVWHLSKTHRADSFRGIKTFQFEIYAVDAWFNDNVDTNKSGEKGTNNIPLTGVTPEANTYTTAPAATGSGTEADPWKVVLGDYSKTDATTAGDDTDYARTRKADLTFGTYTRAGYYVYHIKETDGKQAGVTYDKDEYYLVVYVANCVGANDDTEGEPNGDVYVHSITRWANYDSATAFVNANQNLNQDQKIDTNKDMGTSDDADDNSTDNSRYVKNNDQGKEEISDDETPNEIPVNFDNKEESNGITVSKNVKGTLGDLTKEFEFTITLAGLANGEYPVVFENGGKFFETAGVTGEGVSYDSSTGKLSVIGADENGTTAVLKVKLKDDATVNIQGLPVGTEYTVVEAKSDHAPSYEITAEGKAVEKAFALDWITKKGANAIYKKADGTWAQLTEAIANDDANYTNGKITIAALVKGASSKSEDTKNIEMATATETVDSADGAVEIAYTNHRDITTETGIPGYVFPIVLAAMIALIGLAAMRRRNNVSSVNDFEF